MFGKKRKFRKAADSMGVLIHKQIMEALNERGQLSGTHVEMAFISGYLTQFAWIVFDNLGCRDIGIQNENIKHMCDGVLPGKLWDMFQKGQGLYHLSKGQETEERTQVKKAYELGGDAGNNDAIDCADNNIVPANLSNYLRGNPVEGTFI
jgi:hypothetical protein